MNGTLLDGGSSCAGKVLYTILIVICVVGVW